MSFIKSSSICSLAVLSIISTNVSASTKSEGFEFHGYFRVGAFYDVQEDFTRSTFPGTKEKLGTLGIETDNDYKLALQKNFQNNGNEIRIKTRFGSDNYASKSHQLGTNADASNGGIGLIETYVELDGISDTGTVWGGKRYYGKHNLVPITDFFYTDMSGLGAGIEGIELGRNTWDFAYIASDNAQGNHFGDGSNLNNPMHMGHIGAVFGSLEFHANAKFLPNNWVDVDGEDGEGTIKAYANSGFDVTAIYRINSVFGLTEKGKTQYVIQTGKGLGSGQLLGGTITTYNAWKPGFGAIAGPDKMKMVDSGDTSTRGIVAGSYSFDNGIGIQHSFQAQYNNLEKRGEDLWASATIRPSFPVVNNFKILTELGYQYGYRKQESGSTSDSHTWKFAVAPTITVHSGVGSIAPEIRFLATYLDGTNRDEPEYLVGIQTVVWW